MIRQYGGPSGEIIARHYRGGPGMYCRGEFHSPHRFSFRGPPWERKARRKLQGATEEKLELCTAGSTKLELGNQCKGREKHEGRRAFQPIAPLALLLT